VEVQTRENKFARTCKWPYFSHRNVKDGIVEKGFENRLVLYYSGFKVHKGEEDNFGNLQRKV